MAITLEIDVSYSQISVFKSELSDPFNEWTDWQVDQGFTWRPGSVSFRTICENGIHHVSVYVVDCFDKIHPQAIRSVEVPFVLTDSGNIEVASIADSVSLNLPLGFYVLRCELLLPGFCGGNHVQLIFARKEESRFSVVCSNDALSISNNFIIEAKPAI
ncbi:MAG: competence protein ComJ [Asticcacaulis sp.]